MQIHEIKPNTPSKSSQRVGRGGRRGKTSGRGHKGQKSRAGNSVRPYIREIIKKLPKLRGYGKNRARTVNSGKKIAQVVNLHQLEEAFAQGDIVSPQTLVSKGLVEKEGGQHPMVKILGEGEIKKSLTVVGCRVSKGAAEKLVAAKGTVRGADRK